MEVAPPHKLFTLSILLTMLSLISIFSLLTLLTSCKHCKLQCSNSGMSAYIYWYMVSNHWLQCYRITAIWLNGLLGKLWDGLTEWIPLR